MKPFFSCETHMSNVKVYDNFLSIGHITTTLASGLYLFARLESRLFLDSIPTGLNRYAAFGIKSHARHLKVFFYDKATGSLNMLRNIPDCLVLHLPQTRDDEHLSFLYPPDFPLLLDYNPNDS